MEISGLHNFNAYFQYTANNKNPDRTIAKTNPNAIDVNQTSKMPVSDPTFVGALSLQDKTEIADAYQEELEKAEANNPEKYQHMILTSKEAAAKSFSQLLEISGSNGGTATHNGVAIGFDSERKQMNIGDTSNKGNVISVNLSNGWVLNFNRDNIDDVSKILDLFSPEDIRRIMEAITIDKMAQSKQIEIEDAKAAVASKTADTAAQSGQISEETLAENPVNTDVLTMKDTKKDGSNTSASKSAGKSASDCTDEYEEESEVKTEIITNPDGSRKLVITTKIGNTVTVTNIKLAPAAEENKLLKNKSSGDEESKAEQQTSAFQGSTEFQNMNALHAYEANFIYAS